MKQIAGCSDHVRSRECGVVVEGRKLPTVASAHHCGRWRCCSAHSPLFAVSFGDDASLTCSSPTTHKTLFHRKFYADLGAKAGAMAAHVKEQRLGGCAAWAFGLVASNGGRGKKL